MQKFNTMTDVIALAEFAHRNQVDKAGLPYIQHPLRVMESVRAQGALPYVQMAAVLHDITEDTAFTAEMLLDLGVPEAAVTIVNLLDRDASEAAYVHGVSFDRVSAMGKDAFYYYNIRNNPGAMQVKLADIADNTQTWRLSYLPEHTQARLIKKYNDAKQALGALPGMAV
jgi:(p)ppGpp synthase/HD superfamily hydrolase